MEILPESSAKPCDLCRSIDAVVYCCNESAFMCLSCDVKIHFTDSVVSAPRHGRVWVCEVCEQEPAAVTCKADAAALCVDCDRDIHSANPLARKHERYPMLQFYGCAEVEAAKVASAGLFVNGGGDDDVFGLDPIHCCDEKLNSFIPVEPVEIPIIDVKLVDFLFSDTDQSIEYDNFQLCPQICGSSDAVISIEAALMTEDTPPENSLEIDFSNPNYSCYSQSSSTSFTTATLSHSVSSSSFGVVTDGSSASASEISHPFPTNIHSVDPPGKQPSNIVQNDRVARVLRYQEKRKNRNFKKTVRYASRKAYAETRPRVKGRFTKRGNSD